MKSLIKKLVEINAPSGYETEIREAIRHEIEPLADEIYTDALGNLIARKGNKGSKGMRIMLAAHMDEIGVIVTHIDEKGFARFTTMGGVQARNLPGSRVQFLNGALGVIGLERLENNNATPSFDQLFIDLGATNQENCPVRIADVAAFWGPYSDLGDRLISKAMDDRIGTAVLIEVLRRVKETPHELNFVFSVQEEVGIRGAATAAYGIDPDLGVAVDGTRTGDTPKTRVMEVSLGKGPAVKVRDGGMLSDPKVVDWMARAAEKAGLPYQLEILEGGTTDARAIQVARAGVPSGCVSIPCRYVHAPVEMVDVNDVQNSVRLLVHLLGKPVDLV